MATTNQLNPEEQETLLKLARKTLNQYFEGDFKEEALVNEFKITSLMKNKAGVFVTLKEDDRLRGCIGTIVGGESLYLGVIHNAINSAVKDPRFNQVTKKELKNLNIEISAMTPLQEIKDYQIIRMGIDGVVIKKGFYQAVFLPQVATETGWSLDEFLAHLCQKAGLPADSYKSKGMEFHIFQAQIFHEEH